jgi:hypothetical protein
MPQIHSIVRRLIPLAIVTCLNLRYAAAQEPARLYWDELNAVIVNETIVLDLPDGARLSGTVHDVWPDSLALDVEWTSDPAIYPVGHFVIPRASVAEFELRTRRVNDSNADLGRKAGFFGGLLVGQALGLSLATDGHPHLGLMVLTSATAGGAMLGEHLGTRTETHTSLVTIIPEPIRSRTPPGRSEGSTPQAPASPVKTQATRLAVAPSAGHSGKALIPRSPRLKRAPDTWAMTPSRSRADWAF